MKPITRHEGVVVPFDEENINTDAILPKQFMKSIERLGYGQNLFDGRRYLDYGEPGMDVSRRPLNHEFVLNQPRYSNASVLLARRNFGCGSSREHAPWALAQFGIVVLVAPMFADIFKNNCMKNGLLPIELEDALIDQLFEKVLSTEGYRLAVDLTSKIILFGDESVEFSIDEDMRLRLLKGLDEISQTLQHADEISAFESGYLSRAPWLADQPERNAGA